MLEKKHPEKRNKIKEFRLKIIQNKKSMETMIENENQNNSDMLVGYSALRIFDECYEYNENACYIADTPESLIEFLDGAMLSVEGYRIEPVSISEMLNDFGCSSGEYALEPKALEKFEQAIKESEIIYTVKPYEDIFNKEKQPDLFVVSLEKKNIISQISKKEKIENILEAFKEFDGIYKREQVDEAIELKENITSYLIEILEKIVVNPSEYIEIENYHAHIYALMLLGNFKEHNAHKVIVELFSLPGDIIEELFGDLMMDDLPVILLITNNGNFDLIKSLALNKEAKVSCRDAALKAMVFAVAEGIFKRDELLSLLDRLFKDNPAEYGWDFGDRLAHHVHDIYPGELMNTIKRAYEDELIFPGFIGFQDFENALKIGKEKCLENVRVDLQRSSLDDVHSRMSWWACFNKEKETLKSVDLPSSDSLDFTVQTKKKSKKDKKKKKKIAKASRRQNRR